MKTLLLFALLLLCATTAFAGGTSSGTMLTDANGRYTSAFGLDSNKTISATVTGTKPSFSDVSIVAGTHQIQINCVTPSTGAAAAARVKVNNAGTEIPVNGLTPAFVVPSSITSLAFSKYSTATPTDAVKCTGYGF
jgi:hypothetical protein